MIVQWRGETWGEFFGADATGVTVRSTDGLSDLRAAAANLSGNGAGASRAPLWQAVGSFTVALTLHADTDAQMAALVDAVKAATVPGDDPMAADEFTFTVPGEDARTVYAYVTARQIGESWETSDRLRACQVEVVFEATDPTIYTAEQSGNVAPTLTIIGEGWAPSERYEVTFTGPLTNPMLASSVDASARFRYVGTIGNGDELVISVAPRSLSVLLEGVNAYGAMDGGASNRPAQWFPILAGSQTLTFSKSSGAGTCSITWREAKP